MIKIICKICIGIALLCSESYSCNKEVDLSTVENACLKFSKVSINPQNLRECTEMEDYDLKHTQVFEFSDSNGEHYIAKTGLADEKNKSDKLLSALPEQNIVIWLDKKTKLKFVPIIDIVQIYDNKFLLLMNKAPGITLNEWEIKYCRAGLSANDLEVFFNSLGMAIGYFHKFAAHRDLHFNNIRVDNIAGITCFSVFDYDTIIVPPSQKDIYCDIRTLILDGLRHNMVFPLQSDGTDLELSNGEKNFTTATNVIRGTFIALKSFIIGYGKYQAGNYVCLMDTFRDTLLACLADMYPDYYISTIENFDKYYEVVDREFSELCDTWLPYLESELLINNEKKSRLIDRYNDFKQNKRRSLETMFKKKQHAHDVGNESK